MGADSGSPEVMHLMNKDFQKLEMIYEAAERLTAAGIKPAFNMIFGYPGEEERHRQNRFDLIMNICRNYPARGILDQYFHAVSRSAGDGARVRAGNSGAGDDGRMGGFLPALPVLPWLKGKKHAELQIMRDYLRVAFNRIPVGRYERSRLESRRCTK